MKLFGVLNGVDRLYFLTAQNIPEAYVRMYVHMYVY